MKTWLVMLGGGLITYAIRLSFIALIDRLKMPDFVVRSLGYVPPAVFFAIILPEVLIRQEGLSISPSNERLVAAALATFLAWRTRSVLLTIAIGMACLYLLQWLGV